MFHSENHISGWPGSKSLQSENSMIQKQKKKKWTCDLYVLQHFFLISSCENLVGSGEGLQEETYAVRHRQR